MKETLILNGIWAAGLLSVIAFIFIVGCIKSYAVVAPPPPSPDRDYRVRVVEAVLLAEARGDGPGGVTRVAEVIRNRMIASHRTAIHEVTRPFQFSCLNGITTDTLIERMDTEKATMLMSNPPRPAIPSDTTSAATRSAMNLVFPHNYEFGTTNLTHGATHYHAAGPKPAWAGNRKPCHTYKNHIFYKLN